MKLRNPSAVVQEGPLSQLGNCRSSVSPKSLTSFLKVQRPKLRLALAVSLLLAGSAFAAGQQAGTRSISFPVSIQWTRQKGVAKYRLQIASDETFRSIFFDGRVPGERYTVSGLPPGYYYWRTAPADVSTGRFSTPVRFFVSGGAALSPILPDKAGRRPRLRTAANSH
jgi:hypothetical protein